MSVVTMPNQQDRCRRLASAVAVVDSLGANALLISAMGPVLTLASDTSLSTGVRSLAALVTCAVASVTVFGRTDLPGTGPTGAKLDGACQPS